MFGLLEIRKSYSKAAYRLSDRILKLTSEYSSIGASQHQYGFVPTTELKIQV
jgi:hypothetical protein